MINKSPSQKQRLDLLLVEKGLAPTRSKARDLIKDGHVSVDGETFKKAGQLWSTTAIITLADSAPDFVSRSAAKLAHALAHFDVEVEGQVALDIGASTGGFTEILLQQGASHVYAVDVGHDQLHESLRQNPNVTSLEGRDARTLTIEDFKTPPTIITADVSFISLTKVMEEPIKLLGPGGFIIVLIKPQFELTRKDLNKKGVVRNEASRQKAIDQTLKWFEAQPNWHVLGLTPSPIEGHAGNREVLLWASKEDE